MTDESGQMKPPDITPGYEPQWSTWVRQMMTVGLVIALIYAVTLLAPVIQILIWASLIAFLMFLPSRFIAAATPLNFAGGVVIVYLLLIVALVLLVITFLPPLVEGARNLTVQIQQAYTNLQTALRTYTPEQGIIVILNIQVDLNPFIQPIRDLVLESRLTTGTGGAGGGSPLDLGPVISFATSTITGFIGSITQFFTTTLLALFLSFLILLEMPNYQRIFFRSIPQAHHREMALLTSKIAGVWKGFFRGQVTVGIIIGVVTWLQLVLMGVANPGVLAVITAIVSLIPTIGGIIALLPIGLVAGFQGSTVFTEMSSGTFALLVVLVNVGISQVIWNVVAPKILGDAVALPLPVIIIGVFIGAAIGGLLGAFLIVPILGTLRVVVLYLIKKVVQQDPFPGEEAPPITDLASL